MTPIYVDTSCSDGVPAAARILQRAEGNAHIAFRSREGVTRLEQLYQEGCARICLPRPFSDEAPEAVLINTAGGLTGGDRFSTRVEMGPGTRAAITTQACERIYRSTGKNAEVSTCLKVGAGARLAWLPQETILFNGARLSRRLDAELAGDARLLAMEAICFGRAAMGEIMRGGALHDCWRIRRDGRLIFADDLRLWGDLSECLARQAVLGGRLAMATLLLAVDDAEAFLDPVRQAVGDDGGASAWQGKLVVRLYAANGLVLRRRLETILGVLLSGQVLPKVWQL